MDQLGVLIAEELHRVYADTPTTLAELRAQRIEPNALIFGYRCRGKTPVQLYRIDVSHRIYRVDDVPLDTPVYELTDPIVSRIKKSVYQGWFWDDGVTIRPLQKEPIHRLTDILNVQLSTAPQSVEVIMTYI